MILYDFGMILYHFRMILYHLSFSFVTPTLYHLNTLYIHTGRRPCILFFNILSKLLVSFPLPLTSQNKIHNTKPNFNQRIIFENDACGSLSSYSLSSNDGQECVSAEFCCTTEDNPSTTKTTPRTTTMTTTTTTTEKPEEPCKFR